MADPKIKTSAITLKMYVDLLDKISRAEIPSVDNLEKTEKRACIELLDSGLISDNRKDLGMHGLFFAEDLVITPEGVASLESWSKYLKESSPSGIIFSTVLKALWVLVGALAASLNDILTFLKYLLNIY